MSYNLADKRSYDPELAAVRLPFPLPVLQGKKFKKKCCKKFKKGKRCGKCPANMKKHL